MAKLIFASTHNSDMRYAVKVPITSAFFCLEIKNKKLAFLDKRDKDLILRNPAIFQMCGRKRPNLEEVLLEPLLAEAKKLKHKTLDRNKLALVILKKYKLLRQRIKVPIHFPLDMFEFLRKNGAKLIPTFPLFPERAVKTAEEIKFIKESLSRTKMAFWVVENILRRSKIRKNKIYCQNKILTSEFLKQEAEKALIEKGMFDLLGMIISTGKQTAIPHHIGAGPILPHQPIVCDIFPRHRASGYFSDMTRTYVKGKPSPEIEKMHQAVLKAQKAAFGKIRSGAKAKDIFDAAARAISDLGYLIPSDKKLSLSDHSNPQPEKPALIHGLGHGVGLDIHEKPSLKADSEDILQAGNVITVEPGLYYPEVGGVRIEDMVLVTKTGCQNLTNYPKKFIIP